MRILRTLCLLTAVTAAACCFQLYPVNAEAELLDPVKGPEPVFNEDGYDISGFAWQWPDRFSKDDTIEVTENSYRSHDINIEITRHEYETRIAGDLDENRRVDVRDAVLLSRVTAEDSEAEISAAGRKNADVNEDNAVTAEDLSRLLRYLSFQLEEGEGFTRHPLVWFQTEVYVRDVRSLRGGFAYDTFSGPKAQVTQSVEGMANDHNGLFAINCDYAAFRTMGITYRNGVMYRETPSGGTHEVCIIYKNGVMDVISDADYRAMNDEEKAEIWQTSAFAPALIMDGVPTSGHTGTVAEPNPRSGIGYYEPGHYVFLMVEGRQPGYSDGISLDEYALMFSQLGCSEAFNFDGGSSSVITFMGEKVNHPAWGGRKSSDILYICELSQIPYDLAAERFLAEQETESE